MEQELYEEDVKVVILPDRQEVTSEDLSTMPDVVRERVTFHFFIVLRIIFRWLQQLQSSSDLTHYKFEGFILLQ